MFGISQNKTSSNATSNNIDSSQHTSDNRVSAQNSNIKATGGGSLLDQTGAIVGGAGTTNVSISSVDPGSFAFASDVIKSAHQANAEVSGNAISAVGNALDTVSKLAQGTTVGGFDWKKYAMPAGILIAVIAAGWLLFRRKSKA